LINNRLDLWAELEGVIQDYNHLLKVDEVGINTVSRVQQQMYSPQHLLEAFLKLSHEEQMRLVSRMTLITQEKTLKDLVPND